MNSAERLTVAESLLRPFAQGASSHLGPRLDVVVRVEDLLPAVKALFDARWGYLSAITGLDLPWPKPKPGAKPPDPALTPEGPLEDRLEVLYTFVDGAAVVMLRVTVPYSNARVPTVCGVIPSASLYERELQEMLGITVEGTPDPSKLLLPDDWPDGVYPLRKSFTGLDATKA